MIRLQKAHIITTLVISLLFTSIFCFLTGPVLSTPFSMGDDHRAIAMTHPEKMDPAYKKALFENDPDLAGSVAADAKLGRFRPAGWLWVKVQALLFGNEFSYWRITNLLILFLSALFLSLVIFKLGARLPSAFVIVAVYVFGRNNETWWTLIPPAQNIGELALLAGFYCWLRFREIKTGKRFWCSVLLLMFSALVKESFIFCIPFILMMDFFFLNPERKLLVGEYKTLFLPFAIPFAGLLTVILFSKKIYGYAYPGSVFSILAYNSWQFFFSSVFLIAPLAMFFLRSHVISRRNLLKLIFIVLCWFVVQLVLMKSIKMDDQHHYLVPGILLVLILSAVAIESLQKRSRRTYLVVCSIYLVFAFLQGKNTYTNSRYYAAATKSFNELCSTMSNSKPKRIIYVTRESIPGDWLMGASAIIRNANCEAPLYFCSLNDSIAKWQVDFLKTRPALTFKEFNGKTDSLCVGDWLIFPDDLCREHLFPFRKYDRKYEENRLFEHPYVEISAKQSRIMEKDMLWFGQSWRKLTFHSLLHFGYEKDNCGYYAVRIQTKHIE